MEQESRAKILYADGNDKQRAHYAGILRREYEVVEAETEEGTLDLSKGVDIVVLDISLKKGDGLSLMGRLLGLNHRLPVIIHTESSTHQDTFMTWAADAYIIKQPDGKELMAQVRILAEKRLREKRKPSAAI
jgi:DNA-binding response OmpR family regulator